MLQEVALGKPEIGVSIESKDNANMFNSGTTGLFLKRAFRTWLSFVLSDHEIVGTGSK